MMRLAMSSGSDSDISTVHYSVPSVYIVPSTRIGYVAKNTQPMGAHLLFIMVTEVCSTGVSVGSLVLTGPLELVTGTGFGRGRDGCTGDG